MPKPSLSDAAAGAAAVGEPGSVSLDPNLKLNNFLPNPISSLSAAAAGASAPSEAASLDPEPNDIPENSLPTPLNESSRPGDADSETLGGAPSERGYKGGLLL